METLRMRIARLQPYRGRGRKTPTREYLELRRDQKGIKMKLNTIIVAGVVAAAAGAADACVDVQIDQNSYEKRQSNMKAFLVNNCGAQVEIIDRNTGAVAYVLNPGTKGIAFSTWSWRYR